MKKPSPCYSAWWKTSYYLEWTLQWMTSLFPNSKGSVFRQLCYLTPHSFPWKRVLSNDRGKLKYKQEKYHLSPTGLSPFFTAFFKSATLEPFQGKGLGATRPTYIHVTLFTRELLKEKECRCWRCCTQASRHSFWAFVQLIAKREQSRKKGEEFMLSSLPCEQDGKKKTIKFLLVLVVTSYLKIHDKSLSCLLVRTHWYICCWFLGCKSETKKHFFVKLILSRKKLSHFLEF